MVVLSEGLQLFPLVALLMWTHFCWTWNIQQHSTFALLFSFCIGHNRKVEVVSQKSRTKVASLCWWNLMLRGKEKKLIELNYRFRVCYIHCLYSFFFFFFFSMLSSGNHARILEVLPAVNDDTGGLSWQLF